MVPPDRAEAIACNWVEVSEERDRMLLTLPIADWMRASVAPCLLEVARAPWQPAQ